MKKDWKIQIKQRKTRLPHVHVQSERTRTTKKKKSIQYTHENWLQHDGEHKYRRHLAQRCTSQRTIFDALDDVRAARLRRVCIGSGLCCWNEITRLSWRCRCYKNANTLSSQICFHFELIECNTWQTGPNKIKTNKTNKQTEKRFCNGEKHALFLSFETKHSDIAFTYRNNSRKLSQEKRSCRLYA